MDSVAVRLPGAAGVMEATAKRVAEELGA